MALAGDTAALRLCLERLVPPRRERHVTFSAPAISSAADVPTALAAIIQAVARGDLTPAEGNDMASLVERFRAAYEAEDLESRIAALEDRHETA
jgi:hypothetical protein